MHPRLGRRLHSTALPPQVDGSGRKSNETFISGPDREGQAASPCVREDNGAIKKQRKIQNFHAAGFRDASTLNGWLNLARQSVGVETLDDPWQRCPDHRLPPGKILLELPNGVFDEFVF